MTDRLGDVEARITSVRQLSTVIGAMRGIAAVRSHEANARLAGMRAYAATIGGAIAQALAMVPGGAVPAAASGRRLVIALCAEQGFVGPYNATVLEAARGVLAEGGDLLIVGSRGTGAARERGLAVAETLAMAAHADQLSALANRLADRLFARLQGGAIGEVLLVGARPAAGGGAARVAPVRLLPFDYARFAPASGQRPPLVQLPAAQLLARLADEYVFAQLCEALTLAYAAENEARMRAMIAARENVAHRLEDLGAEARRLRQEAITGEVIELAAGSLGRAEGA
ncbi:MAG TPA: FoF1 ATP synthase subunit gamma [Novosphingobium sp.]|nr:FoF1 ATP synthase subunit gamma [Novosphingobium sp.]